MWASLSQTWPRSRRKRRVKLPEVTQDNCLIFQIWIKHAQSHCAVDFVQCWEYGMERDRWDWHMIPVDLLLLSLPLLLFVISLPLPPPLTHSLPNLTGGEREGTGHSPPPLPIFWQRLTRQQSQSTQDMGEKTTDSSVRLDWEQHSSHVSSAESLVGLDLPLIQHKRARRNKLPDCASFLLFHFA